MRFGGDSSGIRALAWIAAVLGTALTMFPPLPLTSVTADELIAM